MSLGLLDEENGLIDRVEVELAGGTRVEITAPLA